MEEGAERLGPAPSTLMVPKGLSHNEYLRCQIRAIYHLDRVYPRKPGKAPDLHRLRMFTKYVNEEVARVLELQRRNAANRPPTR